MSVEEIIRRIEALTPTQRREVKAALEAFEHTAEEPPPADYADPSTVRQAAAELMNRFPESLRQLANQ